MQVIGFNFTKISSSREKELRNLAVNTNMELVTLEKEKIETLKDKETYRTDFKFSINYQDRETYEKAKDKEKVPVQAQVLFEGNILLIVSPEEGKDLVKNWKRKDGISTFKVTLFNVILRKCTPKALALEDELNMPLHIAVPQFSPQNTPQQ